MVQPCLRYYLASYVGPTRDEVCPLIGSNGLVALAYCSDVPETLAEELAERTPSSVCESEAQCVDPAVGAKRARHRERLHFVDGEPLLAVVEDNRGASLEMAERGTKGVMVVHEAGKTRTTSCENCLENSRNTQVEENVALVNMTVHEEKS